MKSDDYQIIVVMLWLTNMGLSFLPLYLDRTLLGRRPDWFSPLLFELLVNTFLGGFRPLVIAFSGWYAGYTLNSASPEVVAPLLAYTLFLGTIGNISMLIGYYNPFGMRIGKKLPVPHGEWKSERLAFILILSGIGAVIAWGIIMHHSGGVMAFLNNLFNRRWMMAGKSYLALPVTAIFPIVLCMIWAAFLKSSQGTTLNFRKNVRIKDIILYMLIFTPAVILLATFGGRSKMAESFLFGFIIFHYLRRRFRLKELLIIFLLAVTFFDFYGEVRRMTAGGSSSINEVIEKHLNRDKEEDEISEVSGIDRTMIVVKGVPDEIPFQYFTTYSRIFTTMIPRSVWADKPGLGEASVYAPLFGMNTEGKYGSYPAGTVGDFYLQLGVVGVIIGFFIGGICRRVLYEYLLKNQSNPGVVILYAVALKTGVYKLRNQFIVLFLMAAVPFILFSYFARKRFRYSATAGIKNSNILTLSKEIK
jgi:hypothetical protein